MYTFQYVNMMFNVSSDGYTTDDIIYLWEDVDPVQLAQERCQPGRQRTLYKLHHQRFKGYCGVRVFKSGFLN
jgi:hypothetical protein